MNCSVCVKKKFLVDEIFNGQLMKLFENRRDVVRFLAFCDSSSYCIFMMPVDV